MDHFMLTTEATHQPVAMAGLNALNSTWSATFPSLLYLVILVREVKSGKTGELSEHGIGKGMLYVRSRQTRKTTRNGDFCKM